MESRSATRIALAAVVFTTALSGCATARREQASETTTLLTQAGFTVIKADTPERLAKLKTITPYKVVRWNRKNGKVVYVYAEPDSCVCVYAGSSEQYAKYRQLLATQREAERVAEEQAADEPREFSDVLP